MAGLRPCPEVEHAIAGTLPPARQGHDLASPCGATAHGLNLALILGAERIVALDLGDVGHAPLSRRDAVFAPASTHVDRSTPERPRFPASARVLAPLPIDGHASNLLCCHAIELQAVHTSSQRPARCGIVV